MGPSCDGRQRIVDWNIAYRHATLRRRNPGDEQFDTAGTGKARNAAPEPRANGTFMGIITIDFEASCLPQRGPSYPIEVGIAGHGGSSAWLIQPHASWLGWKWSGEAERLHGITLGQLQSEGQPVEVVVSALHSALTGHRVVADSPFDNYWMEALAMAAGTAAPASIEHVCNIFAELETTDEEIAAAQIAIGPTKTHKHRARYDALWLRALIAEVTKAGSHRQSPKTLFATRANRSTLPNGEFQCL